ncbi:hypothetical protein ACS0TY_033260 [Phlomoides rotata]
MSSTNAIKQRCCYFLFYFLCAELPPRPLLEILARELQLRLEADIDSIYKAYSASTRQSLEAWSASQLDLGIVCI